MDEIGICIGENVYILNYLSTKMFDKPSLGDNHPLEVTRSTIQTKLASSYLKGAIDCCP